MILSELASTGEGYRIVQTIQLAVVNNRDLSGTSWNASDSKVKSICFKSTWSFVRSDTEESKIIFVKICGNKRKPNRSFEVPRLKPVHTFAELNDGETYAALPDDFPSRIIILLPSLRGMNENNVR
jgi:hypothetical protein